MVPQMPPDLRRKLRAAHPTFGLSDLVVRWVAPAGLLVSLLARSWPLAVGTIIVFVLAWVVRFRQFPRIVQGEMAVAPEPIGPPPGPEYMRPYYESWPLLHSNYGHPMVVEAADVWCPTHDQWEQGEIKAMVSPGAFFDSVNLNMDLDYGNHAWKLDHSSSLFNRGAVELGGKHGELWEVRARNAVDKNLYDGANHDLAIAVLLSPDNSWDLVNAHLDALPPWEGQERMRSEMPVALPD